MSEVVTKAELVSAIKSADIGISESQARTAVDTVLDGIAIGMKQGRKVRLTGFGVFEAKGLKARVGRNPATGEQVQVAASLKPSFKASASLKDFINSR